MCPQQYDVMNEMNKNICYSKNVKNFQDQKNLMKHQ